MLAGVEGNSVEAAMLLHVGGVHEQVVGHTGQHLVNMRVVVGDLVFLGLVFCPFGNEVAEADHLHVGGVGEGCQGRSASLYTMWKIFHKFVLLGTDYKKARFLAVEVSLGSFGGAVERGTIFAWVIRGR